MNKDEQQRRVNEKDEPKPNFVLSLKSVVKFGLEI